MEISYNRGIILSYNNEKLYLDPERSTTPIKHHTVVTHAHSDHTAAISGSSITHLNETTMDLYTTAQQRTARNYQFHKMYEPFEIGSFEIEFIKAGHLLGATQIVVRQGNNTFLYTGDFCPEPLLTVDGADTPNDVDMVVMDSTYGNHKVIFDRRDDTRQRIFIWVMKQLSQGNIPIINVSHLGGAQELIKLFNQLANNLPILVHEKISKINQIYNKYGVKLDYNSLTDSVEEVTKNKSIILVPRAFKDINRLVNELPFIKDRITRGIVTGQTAKFGFNSFDFAAPLSTHASYSELIQTVEELDPLYVFTNFGFHRELAVNLKKEYLYAAMSIQDCKGISFSELQSNAKSYKSEKSPLQKIKNPNNPYRSLDELF